MEVVFFILPFPQLLLEKRLSISPMNALLADHNRSRTPAQWCNELTRHDPLEAYIVFDLAHYKERSLKSYQREFLWLRVRRRDGPAEEDAPFWLLKVERTIQNHTLAARLGLWGEATDSITVLNPDTSSPDTLATSDPDAAVCLKHLTWAPPVAPPLRRFSGLVRKVKRSMPRYHFLRASCYSFSTAIIKAVRITYPHGVVVNQDRPPFLIRRSRLLGCFPTLTYKARAVARHAADLARAENEVCGLSCTMHYGLHDVNL